MNPTQLPASRTTSAMLDPLSSSVLWRIGVEQFHGIGDVQWDNDRQHGNTISQFVLSTPERCRVPACSRAPSCAAHGP